MKAQCFDGLFALLLLLFVALAVANGKHQLVAFNEGQNKFKKKVWYKAVSQDSEEGEISNAKGEQTQRG